LSDEQISALDSRVDEFRASNEHFREAIAEGFLGSFKSACPGDVDFEELTVKTVCAPSATLGLLSYIGSLFSSTFVEKSIGKQ